MSPVADHIEDMVRECLAESMAHRIGVAVSGGGDSMALLHGVARVLDRRSTTLLAATVDHGLREESRREAEEVGVRARDLGVAHQILTWQGWRGEGNLQAAARDARYSLLASWAKAESLDLIALGHTQDDQAETVLMRLARSSGVDGLAAMTCRKTLFGMDFVRPLLRATRADLRLYLQELGVGWIDEPSNLDTRFERIKVRNLLPQLQEIGITARVLGDVADHMAAAKAALNWYTYVAARDLCRVDAGNLVIRRDGFQDLPTEIARRLLRRALCWINRAPFAPRGTPMDDLLTHLRAGKGGTLAGCHGVVRGNSIWICREHRPVRAMQSALDQVWDRRWQVVPPAKIDAAQGLSVRALGEKGLAQRPHWRETACPREALLSAPSVWAKERLVAAPLANEASDWVFSLIYGKEDFLAPLLSH